MNDSITGLVKLLSRSEHLVKVWNARIPPGTNVDVIEDDGTTSITKTVSQAWMVGGEPIVSLGDRRGGYLLWRITPIGKPLVSWAKE